MKFQTQAPHSRTCGQTTLAILLDSTTEDICSIMGKSGGTRTADILRVLDHFGVETKSRKLTVSSKKNPLPDRSIIHIRPAKNVGFYWAHWALNYDGLIYDPRPLYSGPTPTDAYLANMSSVGEKMASFLELV